MSEKTEFAVRVECDADPRGEPMPKRFSLGRRPIEICEILDAWLATDHRYFKVRGDDGASYILRNDVIGDRWQLTLYDRTGLGLFPVARPARARGASRRRAAEKIAASRLH